MNEKNILGGTDKQALILASAIDRNYVLPYATMIHSLRANNPLLQIESHIIHYDLKKDDISFLEAVAKRVDCNLHFVEIPPYPFNLFSTRKRRSLYSSPNMSPIAYAKAFIDRFLPDTVKRVLLIDADIMVAAPLEGLDDITLDQPLAAVANIPRKHHHQFNSGFVIADLDRWRDEGIADIAERFLFEFSDTLHSHDQQVLNLIFEGRWTKLPLKWNWMEDYDRMKDKATAYSQAEIEEARQNPVIVHYAVGSDKPWRSDCQHPRADLYLDAREKLSDLTRAFDIVDPSKKEFSL